MWQTACLLSRDIRVLVLVCSLPAVSPFHRLPLLLLVFSVLGTVQNRCQVTSALFCSQSNMILRVSACLLLLSALSAQSAHLLRLTWHPLCLFIRPHPTAGHQLLGSPPLPSPSAEEDSVLALIKRQLEELMGFLKKKTVVSKSKDTLSPVSSDEEETEQDTAPLPICHC